MDLTKEHLYLLSNGSHDIYPENSLVEFKNKMPIKLETNRSEGLEVALSSIGISNNFKNIPTPPNDFPSLLITTCFKLEGMCTTEELGAHICDLSPNFTVDTDLIRQHTLLGGAHEFGPGGQIITDCRWWVFNFENKYYTLNDIKDFFRNVHKTVFDATGAIITFTDDFRIKIAPSFGTNFWVLMHSTMAKAFNFDDQNGEIIDVINTTNTKMFNPDEPGEAITMIRKINLGGQDYFVYQVRQSSTLKVDYLMSRKAEHILDRKFPSVIRVVCDNITAQLFNDKFSKDLVVYCPDFQNEQDFAVTEFASKQYVPIENSIIDSFSIKLLDENNNLIQLLPGHASILNMDLRSRFYNKETRQVRLTSALSTDFPDNNNAIFKWKLPKPLVVNRNWRVALTSISNANIFSTFLTEPETRTMFFRDMSDTTGKTPLKFLLPAQQQLTIAQIVFYINKQMTDASVGSLTLENGRCVFNFDFGVPVLFIASTYLLKILGYNGLYNEKSNFTKILLFNDMDESKKKEMLKTGVVDMIDKMNSNEYVFENRPDLDYLKPNYFIVYSNLVSKSIVGGSMSNVLKVVPIKSSTDAYILSEFRHKEFYELQNTEIDTIEIQLRTHDGYPMNFASREHTILNLEFSNKLEITSRHEKP